MLIFIHISLYVLKEPYLTISKSNTQAFIKMVNLLISRYQSQDLSFIFYAQSVMFQSCKRNFSMLKLLDEAESHTTVIIGPVQQWVSTREGEHVWEGGYVRGCRTVETKRWRNPLGNQRGTGLYRLGTGWIVLAVCFEDTFPVLRALTLAEFSFAVTKEQNISNLGEYLDDRKESNIDRKRTILSLRIITYLYYWRIYAFHASVRYHQNAYIRF